MRVLSKALEINLVESITSEWIVVPPLGGSSPLVRPCNL